MYKTQYVISASFRILQNIFSQSGLQLYQILTFFNTEEFLHKCICLHSSSRFQLLKTRKYSVHGSETLRTASLTSLVLLNEEHGSSLRE